MLSYMPNEIIKKIITCLTQEDINKSATVSKRFASIIMSTNTCVNYEDLDIYSYFENITVRSGNIKLINIVNNKKYISEVFEKAQKIYENTEVEIINPSTSKKSDIIKKTYSITLKASSKINLTELVNLKKLIIYDKKFLENIPDNITDLSIFVNDRSTDTIKYPINLKTLRIKNATKNDFINLENKLKSLYLYGKSSCNIEHLGNSLETLAIYGEYRSKINQFPNKLKYLSFGSEIWYDHQLPELPENLEVLKLPSKSDIILDPIYKFPPQLKKLIFGKDYAGKLNNLPDTLECISLSKYTSHETRQEIVEFPKNLKEITFNEYPKNNTTKIPDSVRVIRVINGSTDPIKYLPPNLERLETKSNVILMTRLPKNCKWYKF